MPDVLFYMVFGLVVGAIANMIDPRPGKGGILGSIALGIVGAVLGGFLGTVLLGVGVTGFNFSSLLVALVGSLILLWVGRMYMRRI